MGENNEYYAEKMRRLLAAKENEGRARVDHSKGASAGSGTALDTDDSAEDFSFEENKKKAPPKNYEEKRAQVKEAEAQAKNTGGKKRRSAKEIIITVILVCAILFLGAFCIYKLFFVISSVTVEGNERYTSEQILASAGINTGENLYSFSSRIAEENIKMYCPNVEDIKVKRTPPGNIVVTVIEEKAYFWADFYGERRALTKDLRVLGAVTEEESVSLIKLKLPKVGRAVAGETVVFTETSAEYVFEVALSVSECELVTRIGTVDLTDMHDVTVTCDGKYILELSDYKDSAAKLKIASKVLEDELFANDNKARIDLSELSNTGVVIDNQLVIE